MLKTIITLSIFTLSSSSISGDAVAKTLCRGHQLLPEARPAESCQKLKPAAYRSPDKKLTALVFAADQSLNATPDMESRLEIRSADGHTIASKDYSSPRGANGYYVDQARWTADSQFFVYNLSSSGGHSPWQSPIELYAREKNTFIRFSDLIDGNPTLTDRFHLVGPHTVVATTWREQNIEKKRRVKINLREAVAKLPPGH